MAHSWAILAEKPVGSWAKDICTFNCPFDLPENHTIGDHPLQEEFIVVDDLSP